MTGPISGKKLVGPVVVWGDINVPHISLSKGTES